MAVYYVFQGETYSQERAGNYIWSPQLNKSGGKNAGYTMMTNVKKGDFILHNSNSKVVAISIAKGDYYEAKQPYELAVAEKSLEWNDEGYRVDTEYFDFEVPLFTTNYREWLEKHYIEGSAFTRVGKGKQQYLCHLADEHAIFLLEKAIDLQKEKKVLDRLKAALADIVGDKSSEYDPVEMETINGLVEYIVVHTRPEWSGMKEIQVMTTSPKTGREIPKRDPQRAADALERADYLCEYQETDRTFMRKNGKPYTEPHHLIPISRYRDFEYSVDIMENIVSLCSHCHNLLHYGCWEEKEPVLRKLYAERKTALEKCGLKLTFDRLKAYYEHNA